MMSKNIINSVLNEDCLLGLKNIKSNFVDVIYLDPPFYTQKTQKLSDKEGNIFLFDDKWNSIDEYINFLRIRFIEMKRVLKNDGNIFCHCDRKASHYIRVLLDEIFGIDNFKSEIIWSYKRWSNSKKGLLDSHQNIYHYAKSKNNKFNIIYKDYSVTTNIDQILQDRERDSNGKSIYKKINGEVVFGEVKRGVPLSDIWEIPFLNPKAKERVGYPTQKPLLLLDRIIQISSNENDIILDPFCGSGTTLVSAKMQNRNYIGFDISEEAVKLSKQRLCNLIKTHSILLKKGKQFYDTKTEFEKSILAQFDCDIVQRNKGLDGILRKKIDGKNVGIKIQKNYETILEASELLHNVMKKKNFSYAILIKTRDDCIELNQYYRNIIIIPSYNLQFEYSMFDLLNNKLKKIN